MRSGMSSEALTSPWQTVQSASPGVHVHGLPGGGQLAVVRKGMTALCNPSCPRRTIPDGSPRTCMCRSLHVGVSPIGLSRWQAVQRAGSGSMSALA